VEQYGAVCGLLQKTNFFLADQCGSSSYNSAE